MSKHTQGPWTVDASGHACIVWAGEMRLCDLRGWGHLTGIGALHLPPEEAAAIQDANARLIAAAPELLEACRALLEAPHEEMAALDAIKAAVVKAETGTCGDPA